MTPGLQFPAGIDRARFMREYWQQRPLLMRGALLPACFALDGDELAGLACEDEIESRLVVEHGRDAWELRHGPFAEQDFAALPDRRWTLLVQDVDKFVPAVAALVDRFDFLPAWRIDDVMISYAADQGGVGPHSDAYDVFLMQARGRRRWRLSYRQYGDGDLIPRLEQRILARFDVDEDWVLEPGDVLYLPPGVAHWGTAEGDCMTYSLGCRTPSRQELAAAWFEHLHGLVSQARLDDPKDLLLADPSELGPAVARNAAAAIAALPDTESVDFRRWLGGFFTEPKPQFQVHPPEQTWDAARLAAWVKADRDLLRHPFVRMAWSALPGPETVLFVHGEAITAAAGLAAMVQGIAARRRIAAADLAGWLGAMPAAQGLLLTLLNAGYLEGDDE